MELEEILPLKEKYLSEFKYIAELEKKLEIAVKALEFYGDKENWQAPEDQGFEHHDTLDNSLADMIHEDHDKKTGGKRARQALAAINGEGV